MSKSYRYDEDADDQSYMSRNEIKAQRKAEKQAKRNKARVDDRMDGSVENDVNV